MADVYQLRQIERVACWERWRIRSTALAILAMSPYKVSEVEVEAVTNFREYLRIPSVQPDVNYGMLH
jgi:hypothetical protein